MRLTIRDISIPKPIMFKIQQFGDHTAIPQSNDRKRNDNNR